MYNLTRRMVQLKIICNSKIYKHELKKHGSHWYKNETGYFINSLSINAINQRSLADLADT